MFEESKLEGHKRCGTCLEEKPVEEFYKDGKDKDGNTRYRRDCKKCYKEVRESEKKVKKKR